MAMLNKKFML